MTKPTWEYINPAELVTNGIYTEQEQLSERIMIPVEKPALLNDLAREMRRYLISNNEGALLKSLNDGAVENIIESIWSKMWTRFITFGTFSAGIIAVIMLIQFFKTLIDIIIQAYALNSVYGWPIHLLGAIWSSVTNLLLHVAKQPYQRSLVWSVDEVRRVYIALCS